MIHIQNFIQATRDSGYTSIAQALAEIIDNSIEAGANCVRVHIKKDSKDFEIAILDDGCGMTPKGLMNALQFGGTDRFNSRKQFGRYGMGLPNSSLSQCKRLEVFTWKNRTHTYWNYLDVDEVITRVYKRINNSKRRVLPKDFKGAVGHQGTLVLWKKMDRLRAKSLVPLEKRLHYHLGQIFRYALYDNVKIDINGTALKPFDPLYIAAGVNSKGGELYGEPMVLPIRVGEKSSVVKVRFSELPVVKWSPLPNKEKRQMRVTKNAGVSILRHGREIDYGWYFMGQKRKENYDDWWRCEVSFEPELDDIFGITHTKQMVNPTPELKEILEPHIAAAAQKLNNRVRDKFIFLNEIRNKPPEIIMAEKNDHLIEPAAREVDYPHNNVKLKRGTGRFSGYKYKVYNAPLNSAALYKNKLTDNSLNVGLNNNHPFFKQYLVRMEESGVVKNEVMRKIFYLVLLALARSEHLISVKVATSYRLKWGNTLKKYLA